MNYLQPATSKNENQNTNQTKVRQEKAPDNIHVSAIAGFISTLLYIIAFIGAIIMSESNTGDLVIGVWTTVLIIVATYLLFAIKVAQQWEKAVVLRLGKFRGLRGPGMFWMIPILDSTTMWIDHRVMVTPFNAEKDSHQGYRAGRRGCRPVLGNLGCAESRP